MGRVGRWVGCVQAAPPFPLSLDLDWLGLARARARAGSWKLELVAACVVAAGGSSRQAPRIGLAGAGRWEKRGGLACDGGYYYPRDLGRHRGGPDGACTFACLDWKLGGTGTGSWTGTTGTNKQTNKQTTKQQTTRTDGSWLVGLFLVLGE